MKGSISKNYCLICKENLSVLSIVPMIKLARYWGSRKTIINYWVRKIILLRIRMPSSTSSRNWISCTTPSGLIWKIRRIRPFRKGSSWSALIGLTNRSRNWWKWQRRLFKISSTISWKRYFSSYKSTPNYRTRKSNSGPNSCFYKFRPSNNPFRALNYRITAVFAWNIT